MAERKIPEALLGSLTGFHEDMVAKGYLPTSRVLKRQRWRLAQNWPAARLGGALVIELRRLRFVNEWPIQLVTNFLPYAMCPAVLSGLLAPISLRVLKAEYGLQVERGWRSIGAVLASERRRSFWKFPSALTHRDRQHQHSGGQDSPRVLPGRSSAPTARVSKSNWRAQGEPDAGERETGEEQGRFWPLFIEGFGCRCR
ncbi:MAG: UTRA domain-containing protein [Anaerolineae bacterium]